MKRARVCNYTLVVPDCMADWDAIAEDSPWEKPRIDSILSVIRRGDVFYDIGVEHGWMSAIFAQQIGGETMVLIEPSQEFWPNIKMTWDGNDFADPLATVQAFCGAEDTGAEILVGSWPSHIDGPECREMAYRHPNDHAETIATASIDRISEVTGHPPKGITIDVEGAELGVLKGATHVLAHDRPHVWVSVHADLMKKDFNTTPRQLELFMRGLDYTPTHLGYDHEDHWYWRPAEWS